MSIGSGDSEIAFPLTGPTRRPLRSPPIGINCNALFHCCGESPPSDDYVSGNTAAVSIPKLTDSLKMMWRWLFTQAALTASLDQRVFDLRSGRCDDRGVRGPTVEADESSA